MSEPTKSKWAGYVAPYNKDVTYQEVVDYLNNPPAERCKTWVNQRQCSQIGEHIGHIFPVTYPPVTRSKDSQCPMTLGALKCSGVGANHNHIYRTGV